MEAAIVQFERAAAPNEPQSTALRHLAVTVRAAQAEAGIIWPGSSETEMTRSGG